LQPGELIDGGDGAAGNFGELGIDLGRGYSGQFLCGGSKLLVKMEAACIPAPLTVCA
jgi:hypothetical protein